MNQIIYTYRVWLVEYPDFKMRYSLKVAITKAQLRAVFNIPAHAKITPKLDNRMKNGGKSFL